MQWSKTELIASVLLFALTLLAAALICIGCKSLRTVQQTTTQATASTIATDAQLVHSGHIATVIAALPLLSDTIQPSTLTLDTNFANRLYTPTQLAAIKSASASTFCINTVYADTATCTQHTVSNTATTAAATTTKDQVDKPPESTFRASSTFVLLLVFIILIFLSYICLNR